MQTGCSDLEIKTSPYRCGLIVEACGRSINLPESCRTLGEVQSTLQAELGTWGQHFDLHDRDARRLQTDSDLTRALETRMLVTATLSDTSIHVIESRREELAQMQWKLVRDQHGLQQSKLAAVSRDVHSLESVLNIERADRTADIERAKADARQGMDQLRLESNRAVQLMQEQLAGLTKLLHTERSLREAGLQTHASDVQNLKQLIDTHRQEQLESVNSTLHLLDVHRKSVEEERSRRDSMDDQHRRHLQDMSTKMDVMASSGKHSVDEYQRAFEQAHSTTHDRLNGHGRETAKLKSDVEMLNQELVSRLSFLEDRCSSLQNRLEELTDQNHANLERLSQRNERVSQQVELLRIEELKDKGVIKDLGSQLRKQDPKTQIEEIREELSGEQKRRIQAFESLKGSLDTQHCSKLAQLESRVHARLEREAAAHEGKVQDLVTSIASVKQSAPAQDAVANNNDGRRTTVQTMVRPPQGRGSSTSTSIVSIPAASPMIAPLGAHPGPFRSSPGAMSPGCMSYDTSLTFVSSASSREGGLSPRPIYPPQGSFIVAPNGVVAKNGAAGAAPLIPVAQGNGSTTPRHLSMATVARSVGGGVTPITPRGVVSPRRSVRIA